MFLSLFLCVRRPPNLARAGMLVVIGHARGMPYGALCHIECASPPVYQLITAVYHTSGQVLGITRARMANPNDGQPSTSVIGAYSAMPESEAHHIDQFSFSHSHHDPVSSKRLTRTPTTPGDGTVLGEAATAART
ncbi:hypothetical protein F4802DRAFT_544858 [Xylaria palmicola]|nr:hypothetical protein F4802DRAFT_544858 [Xylaria palmicola]